MPLLTDRQRRRRSASAVQVRLRGSSTTTATDQRLIDRRPLMLHVPTKWPVNSPKKPSDDQIKSVAWWKPVDANSNHGRRAACHVVCTCTATAACKADLSNVSQVCAVDELMTELSIDQAVTYTCYNTFCAKDTIIITYIANRSSDLNFSVP